MLPTGQLSRGLAYSLIALNGMLSMCVFLGIKVPGVFATPSVFALSTLTLLLIPLYLLEATGQSRLAFKLVLLGYFLLVLLAFPKVFNFMDEPFSKLFSFGLYRMILVILAFFTLQSLSLLIFGREVPVWGLLVIVPALILLMHWFFNPGAPSSEFKTLAVILVAAAPIGLLWGWFRRN